MGIIDDYLSRSGEIAGDRTPEEKKYDDEILKGLRKGQKITEAVEKANLKYPEEALAIDKSNSADLDAHYQYLLEHENIIRMRGGKRGRAGEPEDISDSERLLRPATVAKAAVKTGRNDPCPCGSGKKHKKCCGA